MTQENVEQFVKIISVYEGMSIEEAKLTYAARKKLPKGAFCGPNRTYPANDAAHVRNAFARLAQFGHRLPPKVRAKIYGCLRSRAKKYGVEHNPKKYKWGKAVRETQRKVIFEWYLEELERVNCDVC